MTEQPAAPSLTRDQVSRLTELARETRSTEYALIRLVLTVSGGALALSIGFALGERRIPIPLELVPYLRGAWLSLIASMGCGLLSAAITALTLTLVSKLTKKLISGDMSGVNRYVGIADNVSTALAAVMVVLCVTGLGLLAFVALRMVGCQT